jgi:hypothetical protein
MELGQSERDPRTRSRAADYSSSVAQRQRLSGAPITTINVMPILQVCGRVLDACRIARHAIPVCELPTTL